LLYKTPLCCNKCFNGGAINTYKILLEYCNNNQLQLMSDFTCKSEHQINSNGKISTVYNQYEFKCLKCNYLFNKSLSPDSTLICPNCNDLFPSKCEYVLSQFLQDNCLKFIKSQIQSNSNIQSRVEIDFLIDNKLGIELHGLQTHATTYYKHSNVYINSKPKNYHLNKLESAVSNNIDLIQFWNTEWIQKEDICKSIILSRLGMFKYREYARNCYVKEIDKPTYSKFMNEHHIQGTTGNESVRLGLFYNKNDNLISVMSFGSSRFDSRNQYEIFRFATYKYTQVVGAASKLFKYFMRNYNPESIISYSDRRIFNNGKLYETLGFKFSHNSDPDYWYFKKYSHEIRTKLYHRSAFMKHTLKEKLNDFDSNLTEWENMEQNGYLRVYDCGNKVYVWNK